MLPPRHSVTLYPSSLNSPVNSRLTPPSRDMHSPWMRRQEESSLMIVPKWRVFRPDDDTRVLKRRATFRMRHLVLSKWGFVREFHSLSVHRVADPDNRMA